MSGCGCAGALPRIKQGDACFLPVTLYFNGAAVTENELPLLEEIEYCFAGQEPETIPAAESFQPALGQFLLPVSQRQTLDLETGKTTLDVRVKFLGGGVLGARDQAALRVTDALSGEVL